MQNINKLIRRNSALASLSQSITEQQHLLKFVHALLPKSIAPHCLAAVRNESNMTLFVDSSAWSSRLRYLTPELLKSLNNNEPRIDRIKIRVIPPTKKADDDRPKRHPKAPSREEAEHIKSAADYSDDPELSAALRRLAQHLKGSD